MSERRRLLLSRPRTKVYDCNYNIGERYYKPVVDDLDRKYTGRSGGGLSDSAFSNSTRESVADRLAESIRSNRRTIDDETSSLDELPQRSQRTSNLLDEFDSIFDNRKAKVEAGETTTRYKAIPRAIIVNEDSDFDDTLQRMRASRAARTEAFDDAMDSTVSSRRKGVSRKLDIQSEIDNFFDEPTTPRKSRLSGRSPANDLDDEPFFSKPRRALKTPDIDDLVQEPMKKLGALKASLDDDAESAALARARKSRARLAELEAELEEISERPPRGRRALLSDDDAFSTAATAGSTKAESVSSVRVKRTVQTEKKSVNF